MGYLCDFCGEQRSIVYCRSDAASLCLSCDCNVHSANALSRRHPRTLVCERCNSQPAFVRCVEEKISLCQNCDWLAHVGSNISPSHKRQAINCYSGSPSASELSGIWPFLLDFPSVGDSTCEQGMGSMSISDNTMDHKGPQEKDNIPDESIFRDTNDQYNVDANKSRVWMKSPTRFLESRQHNVDQMDGSTYCANPKEHVVREVDGFYDNLNMEEMDMGIENYDELFCAALDNPENLFGKDGIFGMKDMTTSDCQVYAAEGSTFVGANVMQPACSNVSADSVISCKTEPNFCFARQTNSNLSFSGVTGESSAGDYQDCGVSSIPMTGEPPWYPPGPETSRSSTTRTDAVMRYKEKKKARKFEKKVRYESRKARADVRRRVKGRFVKVGEAYDYDPLTPTKSC